MTTGDGATKADVKACIGNLFLTAFVDYQPTTETGRPDGEQLPNRGEAALQESPCEPPQQGVGPLRPTLRPTGPRTATITITLRRDPESPARPRRPAPWATVTDTRRSQAVRSLWSGNAGPSFSP